MPVPHHCSNTPTPSPAAPEGSELLLVHRRGAASLLQTLEQAGLKLDCAYTRHGACTLARKQRYTVILALGWDVAGWLAALRTSAGGVAAPVIVLLVPAHASAQERLAAYRSGADLCLSDWTDIEVLTRVQAWQRRRYGWIPRSWNSRNAALRVGPECHVFLGNLKLPLSPTKRAILAAIINAGHAGIRPAELCAALGAREVSAGSLRVQICAIRKMLLSYVHAPRLVSDGGHYRIDAG